MLPAMDVPATEGGDGLVMAMPRERLWTVSGFIRKVDMAILEAVAADTWFATAQAISEDPEAKRVRIGLLVCRGDEALVSEAGEMLHACDVPAEVGRFGTGLLALRELARAAAAELLKTPVQRIHLLGYLNDDALPETRPFLIMVYEVQAPAGSQAPTGMNWIQRRRLADLPLDPVSVLVVDGWKG